MENTIRVSVSSKQKIFRFNINFYLEKPGIIRKIWNKKV